MPSLWLDVLELTAILQMRRASGYNDLIMNRTSIESEIKQREAEKVREEEAVYRSAYPEAKNGHDAGVPKDQAIIPGKRIMNRAHPPAPPKERNRCLKL